MSYKDLSVPGFLDSKKCPYQVFSFPCHIRIYPYQVFRKPDHRYFFSSHFPLFVSPVVFSGSHFPDHFCLAWITADLKQRHRNREQCYSFRPLFFSMPLFLQTPFRPSCNHNFSSMNPAAFWNRSECRPYQVFSSIPGMEKASPALKGKVSILLNL